MQALVDIGLLLETDSPLGTGLVPHPCPAPVWEVLPLEDWQVRDTRARAVEADARVLADDLLNQQAWAPGQHLQTTLGHLATRNKAPREVLLEALALLPLLGPIRVVVGDPTSTDDSPRGGDPHDGHTPVTITVEPASHAHPS